MTRYTCFWLLVFYLYYTFVQTIIQGWRLATAIARKVLAASAEDNGQDEAKFREDLTNIAKCAFFLVWGRGYRGVGQTPLFFWSVGVVAVSFETFSVGGRGLLVAAPRDCAKERIMPFRRPKSAYPAVCLNAGESRLFHYLVGATNGGLSCCVSGGCCTTASRVTQLGGNPTSN